MDNVDQNPLDPSGKNVDPTKQLLQWLFKTKSPRLSLRSNTKGRNRFAWRQFLIAYIDDDEKPYAMCVGCQTFVKYCGRTGTGGLVRHFCFRQIVQGLEPTEEVPIEVPKTPSDTPSPTRFQVEELVHQNSSRIGFVPNYKGKSHIWAQFDIITLDKRPVNFAACKLCRNIVTYVSRTGTGSMARHKCQANKRAATPEIFLAQDIGLKRVKVEDVQESDDTTDATQPEPNPAQLQIASFSQMLQANLQSFRGKPDPSPSPPEEAPEDIIRREYLTMIRRSLDMFHLLRNESFFDLAQTLINLGAEFGRVDIRQILGDNVDIKDILNDNR